MLKIQKLMIDDFGIEARSNDMLADMSDLASKIGTSESAENDQFVSSPTLTHKETISWPSSGGHDMM